MPESTYLPFRDYEFGYRSTWRHSSVHVFIIANVLKFRPQILKKRQVKHMRRAD
jgi:hypothetical protein